MTAGADIAPHLMAANSSLGFVASASSEYDSNSLAYKAFDGMLTGAHYWITNATNTGWLQLDLGSGHAKILGSYSIVVNTIPEANRAPNAWTMLGSNDGTNWDTLDTRSAQTAWSSGEARTFACATTSTAYRYFRLNITANNGDTYLEVAELYLYEFISATGSDVAPHTMTSDSSVGCVASASSEYSASYAAYKVFDGSTSGGGHYWVTATGSTGTIGIDFGAGNTYTLYSYALACAETARMPKAWTLEGSNDGSTWTTIATEFYQAYWSVAEKRYYQTDVQTTAYRYFRLNVSANNGDALLGLGELYLYGVAGGGASSSRRRRLLAA